MESPTPSSTALEAPTTMASFAGAETSHLSDLPVEIRDKMFMETISLHTYRGETATSNHEDWFTDCADIFQVSEHTKRKAEKIYYSTNLFRFVEVDGGCDKVSKWLDAINLANTGRLPLVTVYLAGSQPEDVYFTMLVNMGTLTKKFGLENGLLHFGGTLRA
ncbi:hypothetical protein LTR37_012202 [Vermiconidia calcicola]|uniref:Uncharacterized protein n=1 Tax=Vermiconidia calcicola TaxID=1690605 RepID=A0ACC3N192_9PEZI|nr:hypothetical protein LTR37_012202 [Vermiconidia calcicola]